MRLEAGKPALETVSLTENGDGLRIVQISDVHIRMNRIPLPVILALIKGAKPDVIAMTGDYIDNHNDVGAFLLWMGELIGAIGDTTVYMCFGNHDMKTFRRYPLTKRELTKGLKQMGAYILENRTLTYVHKGRTYAITGFSDYYSPPYRDVRRAMKGAPKDAHYHIGLSHNPDLAMELSGPRPDLLLLGHFHGGQIWLPFHLEYTCLRKEYLCKTGVRRGLHMYNGRRIYISRGLGCVLFPLRLGSRPEITLFIVP